MRLTHWYHAYCVGDWRPIIDEHLDALEASGLDKEIDRMNLGLVGAKGEREAAFAKCEARLQGRVVIMAQANIGWEQLTLNALAAVLPIVRTASDNIGPTSDEDAILYCHTKGIAMPKDGVGPNTGRNWFGDAWRRNMTAVTVGQWHECVTKLEKGYDLAGCFWIPGGFAGHRIPVLHFQGNFWWARTNYLKRLPACWMKTRHDAEAWVGSGNPKPRVFDALPGVYPAAPLSKENASALCPANPADRTRQVTVYDKTKSDGTWGNRADWDTSHR